ncbi:hypothetical protein Tco_0476271 [Tanacetum coccineum]
MKQWEELIREKKWFRLGDIGTSPRCLAHIQTRRPRSDRGKARRSVSSSSSHHQGTSSHQHDDDDDDVETSRASTPSPTTYLNSLHPLDYQNYQMPSSSEQTDETYEMPRGKARHFKWGFKEDGFLDRSLKRITRICAGCGCRPGSHISKGVVRPECLASGSSDRGYDSKRQDFRGQDQRFAGRNGNDRQGQGNYNQRQHRNQSTQDFNQGHASGSAGQRRRIRLSQAKQKQNMPADFARLPPTTGRVYATTRDQAAKTSGTITGILYMRFLTVFVLFDTRATHSIISTTFAKKLNMTPTPLIERVGFLIRATIDVYARTLISHGCQGFSGFPVMDSTCEDPNIENLSLFVEFADVFPDELPGIPPAREIEFGIELIPGAEPISKALVSYGTC